ncbi:cytochrome-c oxidase, cbb3-type subunit III [Thioclava sp. F34-6]|uniref:cytochrome-c oxidase, cbb3-type subunit III n=1 Tax=Thioclava sp. F34-6 TaxID=1973003 RepID=UPI000B53E249|nr:cytochrome-c oxidase, cbb3-type subunit III [Thioclava sp. F34-6]OWY14656.1 cytochrome-c oxidase, cbb3-type subunit III [Thioclava sp. F34-6]
MSKRPSKQKHEVETTGHSWDGIEEYNNPLPKWWLWTFYACVIWGIGYSIAMPAWPIFKSGATPGILGSSTRANVQAEIDKVAAANKPIQEKLVSVDLNEISSDPELKNYTQNAGAAVFRTWCAQCHGAGAGGNPKHGYPNLLDSAWLWGGTMEDIHFTVTHGIRNETDPEGEARFSQMPAFGKDGLLEPEQIDQVVQYVRKISDQEHDEAMAAEGETIFADNCAACHGEDGKGDNTMGAPNLTDAVWLYGGDVDTLTYTVTNARFGVMPNWNERLSEADIRAVAAYVHSLGGGQ